MLGNIGGVFEGVELDAIQLDCIYDIRLISQCMCCVVDFTSDCCGLGNAESSPTTPSPLRGTPPSAFARATADKGEDGLSPSASWPGEYPKGEGVFATHRNADNRRNEITLKTQGNALSQPRSTCILPQRKATGMAVVTGAEIRDRESFQAWLEARPDASRRAAITVMASRIALRVLPMVNGKGKLTLGQHTTLIKVAFWHIAISRSVRTWPDREIADVDAADDDAYAASAATYAAGAAGFAARAATYAADAATYAVAAASDAATYAATYATFAADEASYAAGAAADEVTWEYIRSDAAVIEAGEDPFTLLAQPLWQAAPPWWRDEWEAFKTTLTAPDLAGNEWGVWIEWYEPITQGLPAFNLKNRKTADALERRIALGDRDNKDKFNKDFWNRKPDEINREIAQWVAEAKRRDRPSVSIQYAVADRETAQIITPMIQEAGFRVTKQEEFHAVGANDIKVVRLDRPIIRLLTRPMSSARSEADVIQIPLYDRSADQARKDIADALHDRLQKLSPADWRKEARDAASHIVERTSDGKWDMRPADGEHRPFLDSEILRLPGLVLQLAKTLLKALAVDNYKPPEFVRDGLQNYIQEREDQGSNADNTTLQTWANILEAQAHADADSLWVSKNKSIIDQFLARHRDYIRHYPAIVRRDTLADQSSFDPVLLDKGEFHTAFEAMVENARKDHAKGLITDRMLRNIEGDDKQRKFIRDNLSNYKPQKEDRVLPNTGELTPDQVKKRKGVEIAGKYDRALETITSIGKEVGVKLSATTIVEGIKKVVEVLLGS